MTFNVSMEEIEATVKALTAEGQPYYVADVDLDGETYPCFQYMPPSLRELFGLALATNAAKDFLVYNDERYTVQEGYKKMCALAKGFQEKYNIQKGDKIAIAMRNYPEWIWAFMTIVSVGGVAVPLNAWWTGEELDYALENSEAKIVFCDNSRAKRMQGLIDKLDLKLIGARKMDPAHKIDCHIDELYDESAGGTPPTVAIGLEDDATLLYTSGSTDYPKGVLSTHRNVLSTIFNWGVMATSIRLIREKKGQQLPYDPASMLTTPLFHVTACHSMFLLSFVAGRKVVMIDKWDPEMVLGLIEKERITNFTGVPTMSMDLMMHPDFDKYDLSSLEDVSAGGAARPVDQVRLINEKFGEAVPTIGYGLTETNAMGALNSRDEYLNRPASIGKPTKPLCDIKILNDAGDEVARGEVGEICVRATAVFKEYWKNPEATKAAFFPNRWFRTGDLGYMDEDDYVFIVDRIKDIIIRGGENIACTEVEAAIDGLGSVHEVCVFAVPDERLGEVVGAAIYLKKGTSITADELKLQLAPHLASFKIPEYIWFHEQPLPRIATGKLDRRGLRDHYKAAVGEK